MQRMCWVRRFECAAVLFTFLLFQGAVGNEMSEPDQGESFICSCIIDDKIYNLAPLKSRDGSPRFVVGTEGHQNTKILESSPRLYPSLTATINFKCDPSLKRIKDAKFEIIHDNWPMAMTF
ncbi:uncharacterized protein [Porites lutea]|uniref:uncharacterized protein isoform X5 n=1 Tax=Porites lutea TaxID=51062 RepID=UPI003CC50CD8